MLFDIFNHFWEIEIWKSDVSDYQNFEIFGPGINEGVFGQVNEKKDFNFALHWVQMQKLIRSFVWCRYSGGGGSLAKGFSLFYRIPWSSSGAWTLSFIGIPRHPNLKESVNCQKMFSKVKNSKHCCTVVLLHQVSEKKAIQDRVLLMVVVLKRRCWRREWLPLSRLVVAKQDKIILKR